jgi:chemotaxis protein MotB
MEVGTATREKKQGGAAAAAAEHAKKPRRQKVKWRERLVHSDDGEGNWLVSYADMMTLMFCFFVILSAFSKPDPGKLEQLKEETSKSMGVKYENPYQKLSQVLEDLLKNSGIARDAEVLKTDEGITIVSKGTSFFDSGSAELKPQAAEFLGNIANTLGKSARDMRVVVEGHTDNVPTASRMFASNWELSSVRASTVVRLFEKQGFPHEGLRPIGYGDTEPVVPNDTPAGDPIPENQAKNRRIVIRIQRQLPPRMMKQPGGTGAGASPGAATGSGAHEG